MAIASLRIKSNSLTSYLYSKSMAVLQETEGAQFNRNAIRSSSNEGVHVFETDKVNVVKVKCTLIVPLLKSTELKKKPYVMGQFYANRGVNLCSFLSY